MAAPPSRPNQKTLGGPERPAGESAIQRSAREKDELETEVKDLEEELEELKAKYDQYFLGVESLEPARRRDELRKRVLRVKEAFTRNTGLKFRIQTLHARYLSYERLWLRSAREKEEGTYRRDLFKARLHAASRGEPPLAPPPEKAAARKGAEPAAAAQAATPRPGAATPIPRPGATPAPAAPAAAPARPVAPRAPAPPPPAGSMNASQMRALYDSYVAAKRSCNEDTSRLTYEAVANTVSKQIPELMNRFKAKTVEFKVEVKDGKAVLKAIPKV